MTFSFHISESVCLATRHHVNIIIIHLSLTKTSVCICRCSKKMPTWTLESIWNWNGWSTICYSIFFKARLSDFLMACKWSFDKKQISLKDFAALKQTHLMPSPTVSTTPLQQLCFWQCIPFRWTTLRVNIAGTPGPIAVMRVVDPLQQGHLLSLGL